MQDETKRREARMMEAVAGLGGRSALSSEVDLRLGVPPSATGHPGRIGALAGMLHQFWRARTVSADLRSAKTKPFGTAQ